MKKVIVISMVCMFAFYPQVNSQKQSSQPAAKMRIASCQFPVSANIEENLQWIEKQIVEAKLKNADIVHFPECALSGYPGSDMTTLENFRWDILHKATDSVVALARQMKIMVLLGSMHPLSNGNKPHNSLYVIDRNGKIIDRYDKRYCTLGDLKYFSPGDHFVTFKVNNVNCGLLICFDIRFPELYREYRKVGADVIFQSFYNARQAKGSIHPIIMHITAQGHAASNFFYMSLTNSSAPESWPCYFITPNGLVQNKLTGNEPGILISDVDLSEKYYDASGVLRMDAINGKLNSGTTVKDPYSEDRQSIHWKIVTE